MTRIEQIPFETVDRVFDFISEMDGKVEEGKLFYLPFKVGGNWSFVVYSPERIREFALFDPLTEPPLKQAYEGQWGLLEICDGDYANPRYVVLTPDVDAQGLRKQWLYGYCGAHGLINVLAIEDF